MRVSWQMALPKVALTFDDLPVWGQMFRRPSQGVSKHGVLTHALDVSFGCSVFHPNVAKILSSDFRP